MRIYGLRIPASTSPSIAAGRCVTMSTVFSSEVVVIREGRVAWRGSVPDLETAVFLVNPLLSGKIRGDPITRAAWRQPSLESIVRISKGRMPDQS